MPSGIGSRNIGDINSPGSWHEGFMTPLLNTITTLATIACCTWLNALDRTLSCSGLNPGVNSILIPLTNSNVVGSEITLPYSDNALTIWAALKFGWLWNKACRELSLSSTSVCFAHTFVGVIKFVSVPPPFCTFMVEDGLWMKNHSSAAGMAGNDDFLEGPDCVESSCWISCWVPRTCCGLTFLASCWHRRYP